MTRAEYAKRPRRESVRKRIGKRKARAIDERDGGCCVYCQAPGETLDHLKPRSKGGTDSPANLVTACRSCNSARQDMPLAQWARYFLCLTGMPINPRVIRYRAKTILRKFPQWA